MVLLQIYPLITGIAYSFQNYQINRPVGRRFVGLENYIKLFTEDDTFFPVLIFSFVYTLAVVFISYVIGMILALLLNKDIPGRGFLRAMVLLPWVISNTVSATNWKWILNDRLGIVNIVLQELGIIDQPIQFFADMQMAKVTVIMIGIWKAMPFMVVVLLAGLQSIPSELYESAGMDGAGPWKSFWHITMPSIRSVTTMCTTLMFIWQFNNFEGIYLLTEGGPNDATFVLPIHIYYTSFYRGRISYGSATAVVILIVMLVVALIRNRNQRKFEE